MSDVSPRYLDGFLAAIAGSNGNTGRRRSAPVPAARDEPLPSAALTPEERVKREGHPLDAWPRVLRCADTNQPPGADDRFRFRWFGLFYQGPAQDAFVLRLRLPGGRLRAFQLAGLAEITQELAGGCVVCNPQGGLDLPGVPVRAAAEIVRRVEAVGLCSLLTGGDCVQAVRGGENEEPAAPAHPAAVYPLVCALEQALRLDRQLADLPGSCEVVFSACDAVSEHSLVVFQTAADGSPEYRLAVPPFGTVDLPLTNGQVVPVCLGLLRRWSEHGERSDRAGAGLAEFCAKSGGGRLRDWLAESAGTAAEALPETLRGSEVPQLVGKGAAVADGRLLSGTLLRLADVAREDGSDEVRLTSGGVHLPHATDPEVARGKLRSALD